MRPMMVAPHSCTPGTSHSSCALSMISLATIVRSERESCARQGVEYVQHALVLDRRAVHEVRLYAPTLPAAVQRLTWPAAGGPVSHGCCAAAGAHAQAVLGALL